MQGIIDFNWFFFSFFLFWSWVCIFKTRLGKTLDKFRLFFLFFFPGISFFSLLFSCGHCKCLQLFTGCVLTCSICREQDANCLLILYFVCTLLLMNESEFSFFSWWSLTCFGWFVWVLFPILTFSLSWLVLDLLCCSSARTFTMTTCIFAVRLQNLSGLVK